MCDFKPGDEVVCVNDQPIHTDSPWLWRLSERRIYTVLSVGLSPTADFFPDVPVSVRLVEVENRCPNWPGLGDMGFNPVRFRKVERKNDSLSIEAFLTIKPGFEEPRRAPAKKRERVQ